MDDPPSEVDESSHSVHKDLKGAPPESCTFGVHTSDEDSSSAPICGCKTRCTTRQCPYKQIASFCRKYCHPNRTDIKKLLKQHSSASVQKKK